MKTIYFKTEDLTVGYQGVPLIGGIEIPLEKGEILTLIGPNGAGKSTILKTITGQLAPLGGSVFVDGRKFLETDRRERAKQMGIVLTDRIRTEYMTCYDVVALGRYPYTGSFGVLSEKDHKIVQHVMEQVRVTELAEQDFARISDGQRQRVMLARALAGEPEILILDEPTSYLDIRYKLEFLSILQDMAKKQGLTVILSLHELDLAERIADRVLCVADGKIDRFGRPWEIFEEGYVTKLYQIRDGFYEERTGIVELKKPQGEPEVFVLGGGGSGIRLYRQLQRRQIAFAAGIFSCCDLDYPTAHALAHTLIESVPYELPQETQIRQAKEQIDRCRQVFAPAVSGSDDTGSSIRVSPEWQDIRKELIGYARNCGKYREWDMQTGQQTYSR